MASKKIFHARPNYIFPTPSSKVGAVDGLYEFNESDIWSNSNSNNNQVSVFETTKKSIPSSKKLSGRKMMMSERKSSAAAVTSASLPINIPDWSKILKDEYEEQLQRRRDHYLSDEDFDEDDDEDDEDEGVYRMPPHEYLARKRGASFSVHEGIGRTLKGRDLRRVRNAIWKKTGFED